MYVPRGANQMAKKHYKEFRIRGRLENYLYNKSKKSKEIKKVLNKLLCLTNRQTH